MFRLVTNVHMITPACLGIACVSVAVSAPAGTKISVGRSASQIQRLSMDHVDHSEWTALLNKYVDDRGRVDYASWKRSTADGNAMEGYLSTLSKADARIRASREGRLAFWINAYNAVTIKGILREYPTSSIRNHTAKLYGYNIWHDLLLVVGDAKISLHEIEHKMLRTTGEPLIHFAIVCASHSCPRLLQTAYTADKLHNQLANNARHFFANPENFRHEDKNRRFYLSSIMKWFAEDFGSNQAAQLKTIAPYLPSQAAYRAAQSNSVRISYLPYDWNLNDRATLRVALP